MHQQHQYGSFPIHLSWRAAFQSLNEHRGEKESRRKRAEHCETDNLLTIADREEELSFVYVRAIAAQAAYATAAPSLDRSGVDLSIHAGGATKPALDLQLKASVNLAKRDDGFVRHNYDLLRIETQTPRLLVVLDLPADRDRRAAVTEEKLILRNRAYWLSLRGFPETANEASITVKMPEVNLFNIDSMRCLIDQSRRWEIQ